MRSSRRRGPCWRRYRTQRHDLRVIVLCHGLSDTHVHVWSAVWGRLKNSKPIVAWFIRLLHKPRLSLQQVSSNERARERASACSALPTAAGALVLRRLAHAPLALERVLLLLLLCLSAHLLHFGDRDVGGEASANFGKCGAILGLNGKLNNLIKSTREPNLATLPAWLYIQHTTCLCIQTTP